MFAPLFVSAGLFIAASFAIGLVSPAISTGITNIAIEGFGKIDIQQIISYVVHEYCEKEKNE